MLRTICSFRLVVLLIAAAAVFGCSEKGNSNITLPQEQIPSSTIGSSASGRMLWGMWEISLNPAKDTMTALPARKLQAHFNITDMLLPPECDDCLAIAVNSFDPVTRILDVDVTLRNPSPLNG